MYGLTGIFEWPEKKIGNIPDESVLKALYDEVEDAIILCMPKNEPEQPCVFSELYQNIQHDGTELAARLGDKQTDGTGKINRLRHYTAKDFLTEADKFLDSKHYVSLLQLIIETGYLQSLGAKHGTPESFDSFCSTLNLIGKSQSLQTKSDVLFDNEAKQIWSYTAPQIWKEPGENPFAICATVINLICEENLTEGAKVQLEHIVQSSIIAAFVAQPSTGESSDDATTSQSGGYGKDTQVRLHLVSRALRFLASESIVYVPGTTFCNLRGRQSIANHIKDTGLCS